MRTWRTRIVKTDERPETPEPQTRNPRKRSNSRNRVVAPMHPTPKYHGKRKTTVKKDYSRHRKPPYTWQALAAAAIICSPEKKLTVSGIVDTICGWFPYLGEGYTSWRDSIRHNLSQYPAFRFSVSEQKKICHHWTVDLSAIPPDQFLRQKTAESKNQDFPDSLWDWLELHAGETPHPVVGSSCSPVNTSTNSSLDLEMNSSLDLEMTSCDSVSSSYDPLACSNNLLDFADIVLNYAKHCKDFNNN